MSPSPFTHHPSPGLFITGTDTGVGKTLVTVALIEALKREGFRVAGMKPVASGLNEDGMNEDVSRIMASANVNALVDDVCPYRFEPAVAPHVAASRAGISIELRVIAKAYYSLLGRADRVVVEGAGGFLVPLNKELGMDAIPASLDLPVVLVVGMRMGCLNHALLTVEAIQSRGLMLAGWVANQIDPGMQGQDESLETLGNRMGAPCIGFIPWIKHATDLWDGTIPLDVNKLVNNNTLK